LARARNRHRPRLEGRRRWEPGDLEDLLLVESFARQEGLGEGVELFAVGGQETPGLFVALADDPEHFGIDGFGGRLAERSGPGVPA
jgi:hypothetical protein